MNAKHETLQGNTVPRQRAATMHETPRIDSEALFNGEKTVVLLHAGQEYILRITRQGKLILNK